MDTDMAIWGLGVVHYRTSDGLDLAVSVDAGMTEHAKAHLDETLSELGQPVITSGVHRILMEPTVIMACTPTGEPAGSLDRLHECAPGTSHEDALAQIGYAVT
ncbi:hypothetical protein BST13_33460 [Mycobacterium aquaticum]|uniref:DUF7572 domain-containing protein n=2 Tax=Mycobacterium aquaticum TaxID=1927124 RepID=A0A1X0A498_9MYCO|nr:hypothetical protein BST13_33460 [Mycobacterium aquaticum]